MRYFLSAGEASGDLHAGELIKELRRRDSEARFMFLGGEAMEKAAGVQPIVHYRRLAYMGFADVARHLREILAILGSAKRALGVFRPDAVILVDYPSFNLRLAREAKRLGIPVYYYIAPKIWAWKQWRAKTIAELTDHVYSILPFEPDFYRRHGYREVTYVGNPSVEEVEARLESAENSEILEAIRAGRSMQRPYSITPPQPRSMPRPYNDSGQPIVALVPGSRRGEIEANLPVMLAAVPQGTQPVIAGAPSIDAELYERLGAGGIPIVWGDSIRLMRLATVAAVTSGTATLECALAGTPQVVCYRANGSKLTYKLMRRLIHVDYVSLPNLICDRTVVPELLLHNCTPAWVHAGLCSLMPGRDARARQIAGYEEMRRRLGTRPAAATAAADIIRRLGEL